MQNPPRPTDRELEIMAVLWKRGEATVREVYEEIRRQAPLAQNTVQSFLRTMEEKGLVDHRLEGRTFIYRPLLGRQETGRHVVGRLLDRLYDGAIDQLVDNVLSIRPPTEEELLRLEMRIAKLKRAQPPNAKDPGHESGD